MKTLPIGISSCCIQDVTRALFEEYREAGISHMEISVPPAILSALDFPAIRRFADEYGVTLWSVHLPFYPASKVNLSDPDPAVRDHAIRSHGEHIRRAGDAGVAVAVVHPSSGPIDPDADRAERLKYAKDSLSRLAAAADAAGMKLAVENMVRTGLGNRSAEMQALLSDDERLGMTFDINHPLYENPIEFIKPLLPRLTTIHVSDYDGYNERHWMPGEGIIDWNGLFRTLTEGGYTSPWMYELRYECPKTIARRTLKAADYRKNAETIFSGRIPEPIGQPIPEVCREEAFLDKPAWLQK